MTLESDRKNYIPSFCEGSSSEGMIEIGRGDLSSQEKSADFIGLSSWENLVRCAFEHDQLSGNLHVFAFLGVESNFLP